MNVEKGWILTFVLLYSFTKYLFCLKYKPKLHVSITMLMKLKFIFIKAVINYREKKGKGGKRKNKEKRNEFPWHVLFFRTYPLI